MFKVVASDLDGTLLAPDHSLTTLAKETLQTLSKNKGVDVVLATGRHHVDVARIRNNLNIDHGYFIASNGAVVQNSAGEIIFEHVIPAELAARLYDLVKDDKEILTNVYRKDEWHMNNDVPEVKKWFTESNFTYKVFKHDGSLPLDGVHKVFYVSLNHDRLLQLEQQLIESFPDVAVCFASTFSLEVMQKGVSKGNALEEVVKLLGHTMQDVVSFGDSMNDLEMLSMSGKGCLMENAQQRLKDSLPSNDIIGSNTSDAVPNYLRRIYSL
ncbi:hypothetical protein SAMD00019534_084010 [Acytostelium subglobosum LB1]|uniref:hypothetical protein n=1 Tax=Acytostelium subglobosum LB1 TaxID=1410327 RepID=UPI000644D021|nr:hypothetical protein SAMD00019534_084010 [Acytostelium subglobosum LB1]GAM25226.1 hypothetical protein SAMD00019534_084010 [Acytostelium subglobosum LB1]|eukprot:XP_012751746.1 hypothetical protein SAMD00019534_084010 [Acytostelium subglobosum LB1]